MTWLATSGSGHHLNGAWQRESRKDQETSQRSLSRLNSSQEHMWSKEAHLWTLKMAQSTWKLGVLQGKTLSIPEFLCFL